VGLVTRHILYLPQRFPYEVYSLVRHQHRNIAMLAAAAAIVAAAASLGVSIIITMIVTRMPSRKFGCKKLLMTLRVGVVHTGNCKAQGAAEEKGGGGQGCREGCQMRGGVVTRHPSHIMAQPSHVTRHLCAAAAKLHTTAGACRGGGSGAALQETIRRKTSHFCMQHGRLTCKRRGLRRGG